MSSNTLNNRSTGQTILDTFFNDIHSALDGDFVGRGATGIPTSGQNLGTLALPWGTAYIQTLNLNGSSLDTSKITSPANRVISGKKRTSSNQPAFITPNGAAASCLIAGATTNLLLSIGGATVTVNTDITKSSLTLAPSSQNTATVNDATAASQALTKVWGELNSGKTITVTSAGTNITSIVGKFATFKLVHSATTEYFTALVESSTVLSHCSRGYFYDSSLNPINPVAIANSDTITLMKTGFVFMTNDATTVDVTYNFPTWSAISPTSPATGDYWYDTVNSIWKRYDGASFVIINRTLIGMVVMDATNCVAARCVDFYAAYSQNNTVDLEIGTTATNIQARRQFQKVSVAGVEIDYGNGTLPVWNGTNNYCTSADYFAAFGASTTYYLYVKDDGTTIISDIPPYWNPEKYGFYHRHNPWRCIAIATTDGSSNWAYVTNVARKIGQTGSQVIQNTYSAFGAVNTQIFIATNTTQTGTAITYASTANAGDSFTINEDGLYYGTIWCHENAGVGAGQSGFSLNSANMTTAIISIPVGERLCLGRFNGAASGTVFTSSFLRYLKAGDIVRPHGQSSLPPSTAALYGVAIVKVSD